MKTLTLDKHPNHGWELSTIATADEGQTLLYTITRVDNSPMNPCFRPAYLVYWMNYGLASPELKLIVIDDREARLKFLEECHPEVYAYSKSSANEQKVCLHGCLRSYIEQLDFAWEELKKNFKLK